ncbi:glycosyltransferase family 2 protein [Pontibacter populi]|uniref:Glycosyltransferase n=1 Tax=Pontibacter populi TaxID=890055 RepID=A0ABV1RVB0_9BACT
MVSVIVPNYNHEKFLKKRLDSILEQTYKDIEVILLDDCSSDRSYHILMEYANHPKVKIVERNDVNSGSTFKQWLKGINIATGEYVWIAESDDFSDPFFLERMVHYMKLHSDAILSFCNSVVIGEDQQVITNSKNWSSVYTRHLKASGKYDGQYFCENFLINHCVIPNASAVLMRNSELRQYILESQNYKVSGDWYLWFKLLINKNFVFVDENLNYFRTHNNTVRSQKLNLIKEESLKLLEIFYKDLVKYKLSLNGFNESYFDWNFKSLQWSTVYKLNFKNFESYFSKYKLVNVKFFCYKMPRVLYLKMR